MEQAKPIVVYDLSLKVVHELKKSIGPRNKKDLERLEQLIENFTCLRDVAVKNHVTGAPGINQRDHDVETIYGKRKEHPHLHRYVVEGDIDNFGQYNKQYGTQTGNEVLKAVTKILEDGIRDYDVLGKSYHLHGEELELIIFAPNDEIAALVVNRLRKDIETKTRENYGHPVTATFGLTKWDEQESFSEAQQRANTCMNQGKALQKNRVYATTI